MLFYFNVSIKTNSLMKLNMQEKQVEWGGEWYSQEPPQYEYDGTLTFDEFLNNNYFEKYCHRLLGKDFDIDGYRTFRLLGEHLSEIEKMINLNNCNCKNHQLFKFMDSLLKIDQFIIFLICDEEEIAERYQVNTKEELIDIFCSCLKWDSPRGALIIKQ